MIPQDTYKNYSFRSMSKKSLNKSVALLKWSKASLTKYELNREHEISAILLQKVISSWKFDLILLEARFLQFLESHTLNFLQLL